ncbi:hypothetical protein ACFSM5_09415 [Lacibacterium aquatile]|uniref:Uncharacterized protein n=1 Tax=Lacibacterium aquatile TaxID=1168082 RepID=A0ABW5DR99_9PROT
MKSAAYLLFTSLILSGSAASAQDFDIKAFFAKADSVGRVGLAQKTRPVYARPATPGEIVVTILPDDGVETKSKPAEAGDMSVNNRCSADDKSEYLVKAAQFPKRYSEPLSAADDKGWRQYRPLGVSMRYVVMKADEGPWTFKAPWGEAMIAKPGDTIVQDPNNPADTYRVAKSAFDCTYEITKTP